jgi:phosphoglycolate phosphatase-like HAD superfamily hydrolase
MKELKSHPKDMLYVGDQPADMLAAKFVAKKLQERGKPAFHIPAMGVTYGYAGERILKFSPDYVAHKPREILEKIIRD